MTLEVPRKLILFLQIYYL